MFVIWNKSRWDIKRKILTELSQTILDKNYDWVLPFVSSNLLNSNIATEFVNLLEFIYKQNPFFVLEVLKLYPFEIEKYEHLVKKCINTMLDIDEEYRFLRIAKFLEERLEKYEEFLLDIAYDYLEKEESFPSKVLAPLIAHSNKSTVKIFFKKIFKQSNNIYTKIELLELIFHFEKLVKDILTNEINDIIKQDSKLSKYLKYLESKINLSSEQIINNFIIQIEKINSNELFEFLLTGLSNLFNENQISLIINHALSIVDIDKEKSFYLIRLLIESDGIKDKVDKILKEINPETQQQEILIDFIKSFLYNQDYNYVLKNILMDKNQYGTLRRNALELYLSLNKSSFDFDFLISLMDDKELSINIASILGKKKYKPHIIGSKIVNYLKQPDYRIYPLHSYLRNLLE